MVVVNAPAEIVGPAGAAAAWIAAALGEKGGTGRVRFVGS
jgi:hypothetical protein